TEPNRAGRRYAPKFQWGHGFRQPGGIPQNPAGLREAPCPRGTPASPACALRVRAAHQSIPYFRSPANALRSYTRSFLVTAFIALRPPRARSIILGEN